MAGGKRRYEIYALSDPRDGEVRYIGKSVDSQERLLGHIRHAMTKDFPVCRWIRKLARDHVLPTVTVILTVDDDWQSAERAEIAKARAAGARLLNIAEGGEQPHTYFKEYPYITKSYRRLESRIAGAIRLARSGQTECDASTVITLRLAKAAYARAVSSARLFGRMDWLENEMKNSFLFAKEHKAQKVANGQEQVA